MSLSFARVSHRQLVDLSIVVEEPVNHMCLLPLALFTNKPVMCLACSVFICSTRHLKAQLDNLESSGDYFQKKYKARTIASICESDGCFQVGVQVIASSNEIIVHAFGLLAQLVFSVF